ncbi:protein WVD2-like 7 [Neltuma alba]|uniref:protein WVD2-like 7 n=1 Tax=Neltuma alba TaxID=207710 RepID=UPI0010A50F5A|nr:protein WVD2-like 7 [Prosopis alba]
MAESTCLLRSFSNHTDISPCMAKQVDPIRLLGESISFGRYMSEGLDWEKWSVFSHNRHVEEAEKFSKPGSVAEKKAYFEAHYKKKAAQKAAALVQEADGLANETFDSETQDGNCNSSSVQMNSIENSNMTVIEQNEKCDVSYAYTNEDKRDIQQSEVEISKVELPKDMPQPLADTPTVKNFVIVDNSNQCHNLEKVAVARVEKLCDPGNPGKVKAREVKSSPKSSTKATLSKPLYSPAERKATGQARSRLSSVPNSKGTVRGLAEKKRLSTWSLHTSINLPSCAGETSKTVSVLQQNRIKKINLNSPNASRDQPVSSRTSVRAIRDIFNQASEYPQPEGTRTERLRNKSVCKGVTASAELSSPSAICSKSPSTRRPQSSTIASPFRFRSEGRVAKRKEFFQRMAEIKLKEVERMQPQRKCKEKTELDHKKLQQCSGFKPKQKEDKNGELHLPSNEMKKRLLSQPQSPKPGSKATSSTCHAKNSRNSWKPLTGISTPKRVTEKMNQTMRGSVTSLSKKVRQENASPNIQP